MTPEQIFLAGFFVTLITLFLSGKFSVDLVALSGLLLLTLLGIIEADKAFSGFSSSAVMTMVATFILGGALARTGVAEAVAKRLGAVAGSSVSWTVALVMLLAAGLSAFMSNVATAAVLMPAVMSLAHRREIPPSKLLIPLAFGAVLGGMCTVIGTPANIIIAEYTGAHGLNEIAFFEFAIFGLPCLMVGVLLLSVFSNALLPARRGNKKRGERRKNLAKLYQLDERLVSLRIPEGSRIAKQSLSQARIGELIDAQVILIVRGTEKIYAPGPNQMLQVGDELVIRARPRNIERALRLESVTFLPLQQESAQVLRGKIELHISEVGEGKAASVDLRSLRLRRSYGLTLAGVIREGDFIQALSADFSFELGDRLLLIGSDESCKSLESDFGLTRLNEPQLLEKHFHSSMFQASVPAGAPFVGESFEKAQLGEVAGLNLAGVLRGEEFISGADAEAEIQEGDLLIANGDGKLLQQIAAISRLELLENELSESELESPNAVFVEVVLSPRSNLIGETLKEVGFRERYGFQVVAIWRNGRPVRYRVAKDALQFGDALLLQGTAERLPALNRDNDFVVLTDLPSERKSMKAASAAVLGFLVMTLLAVFRLQSVEIAAFTGALIAMFGGAIRISEAYKEVEWRIVFLVACLIPLGSAVESSGLASVIASAVLGQADLFGGVGLLFVLGLLSSVLSQSLDGSVAVILLAPLVSELSKAGLLAFSTETTLIFVTVSASIAFLTPFSHKVNLLVMGAGSYRNRDYFKAGAPLSALCFAVLFIVAKLLA